MKPTAVIIALFITIASALAGDAVIIKITDNLDFTLALENPVLMKSGESLDHIPLAADGKEEKIAFSQIARAELAPMGRSIEINATLAGGRELKSTIADASECFIEGTIAEGERAGNRARFPINEVRIIENEAAAASQALAGMPAPDDDVLWIASAPAGAEIELMPLTKDKPPWKGFKKFGPAPIEAQVPPGEYAVRVYPKRELLENIEEGDIPFEHDGWARAEFEKKTRILESLIYNVTKERGKPTTLIALFQPVGMGLEEFVQTLPPQRAYDFTDRKLEGVLLGLHIPKNELPTIFEGLHRGGKVIWTGARRSIMIELLPGERGWKITQRAPVRERR